MRVERFEELAGTVGGLVRAQRGVQLFRFQSNQRALHNSSLSRRTYFFAVTVISMCAPPASLATPTVVRVGRGSLKMVV